MTGWLKRIFSKKKYILADTTYLSVYPDEVCYIVTNGKEKVVILSDTITNLENGENTHLNCRIMLDFINKNRSKFDIIETCSNVELKENKGTYVIYENHVRPTIDEKIMAVLKGRSAKGDNIKLYTCNKSQYDEAVRKKLKVEIYDGNRKGDQQFIEWMNEYNNKELLSNKHKRPVVRKTPEKIVYDDNALRRPVSNVVRITNKPVVEVKKLFPSDKMTIPYIKRGKEMFISVRYGIAVHDSSGRRRIGKSDFVQVTTSDVLSYMGNDYSVSSLDENCLYLTKRETNL